jgi:hypothetical protein
MKGQQGMGPYSSNGVVYSNSPVIPAPGALASRKIYLDFYWELGT